MMESDRNSVHLPVDNDNTAAVEVHGREEQESNPREDQTMIVLSSDDEEEEIGVGINAIQVVDLTLEDDE